VGGGEQRWDAASRQPFPLFAPVPKPTIRTGVTAMTLAVLSAFDQRAKGQ
jgi:hypothetical protein